MSIPIFVSVSDHFVDAISFVDPIVVSAADHFVESVSFVDPIIYPYVESVSFVDSVSVTIPDLNPLL